MHDPAISKFLRIYRHLRQYARHINDQGDNPRQVAVLRFLQEHGPASVGQVQEFMYTSPSTASALICGLEDAGYVTRTRSEADNRVVVVAVTDAGRQKTATTPEGGIILMRRRIKDLPEDKIRLIDEALTLIMDMMDIEEES